VRFSPIATLTFLAALVHSAWAGDIFVIAHPGIELSADEVRDVFVGEKQTAGPVKLNPVDNAAAQADLLSKVVKVDAAKYAAIWAKKGFRDGVTPPPVRGNDAEVIAAVKTVPGTIGYVSKAVADVKVIAKY
jgi:ABC-type phosphate transport system substrate-binding protein